MAGELAPVGALSAGAEVLLYGVSLSNAYAKRDDKRDVRQSAVYFPTDTDSPQ